jgi:hypothetical protein
MQAIVARSISQPRFYMTLLGAFAGIALLLAALGIYGVIAYAVSQRTRELGIRVALGATREKIVRLVIREGVWLAGVGGGLGIVASFALTRAISSLTFGDIVPRGGLERALVDLETIVGLTTFTLALGYVVTAFGVLGKLENLHGRVRRHAEDPAKPSSILSRHFRGGDPGDLPSFLQALGDDLEDYDQGLRRYPVVYYFHTRRRRRSIPHVFATLGELLALLRWGLATAERIREDPFLAALVDGYAVTLERLRRSFVGPVPIEIPEPLPRDRFADAYAAADADGNGTVRAFRRLEERARESTGQARTDEPPRSVYERYREWLDFAYRQQIVLDRVADELGYERPRHIARL